MPARTVYGWTVPAPIERVTIRRRRTNPAVRIQELKYRNLAIAEARLRNARR